MPTAWRSEYYVRTAHAEHGPYPTQELAERIRDRLAANGSDARIYGSAQLVEYAGTATVELKADDSQLQAALDRAEKRIAACVASMQAVDSLFVKEAADELREVRDAIEERLDRFDDVNALQQDALAALDRRLQAIEEQRSWSRETVKQTLRDAGLRTP